MAVGITAPAKTLISLYRPIHQCKTKLWYFVFSEIGGNISHRGLISSSTDNNEINVKNSLPYILF